MRRGEKRQTNPHSSAFCLVHFFSYNVYSRPGPSHPFVRADLRPETLMLIGVRLGARHSDVPIAGIEPNDTQRNPDMQFKITFVN